jgi:hypothetical protein
MQNDCFAELAATWLKQSFTAIAEVNPRYRLIKGREYPFVEMSSVGENFGGIKQFDSRKM